MLFRALSSAEGLRPPPDPPDPPGTLALSMLAFLLIMITLEIMSVFYLILFPTGFFDTHPGQEWHETETNLFSQEK